MLRTTLPVLAGADLGTEFRSLVDAVAVVVPPQNGRIQVLLDDLPDSSARLDLVRPAPSLLEGSRSTAARSSRASAR